MKRRCLKRQARWRMRLGLRVSQRSGGGKVAKDKSKTTFALININLPDFPKSRAVKAIGKLIGAIVDIPTAYAERPAEKIRAETKRQILFDDSKNEIVINLGADDDDFAVRTRMFHENRLLKGQYNREKVAQYALEDLSVDNVDNVDLEIEEVSEDWLDNFSSYTEKVSIKEMQKLWAKILAGEIRQPGSFSLSTLRLMSEMDKTTAERISRHVNHVLGGSLITYNSGTHVSGNINAELLELEALGILTGVSSLLNKPIEIPESKFLSMPYIGDFILVKFNDDVTKISLPSIPLTRIGKELLSLLPNKTSVEFAKHFTLFIKDKFEEIMVAKAPIGSGNDKIEIIHRITP